MKRKRNVIHRLTQYCWLFLLPCLCLHACKDLYEDDIYTAFDELPIGMYLKENPDDYSQWVALMEHAGLYSTLNLRTTYTFFVPTNDGVNRYLQAQGYGAITDIPKDDAAYLVKYHLIHGVTVDLGQFQSGAINDLNETDDNLSVEFRGEGGGLDAVYLNGEARFIRFDIQATNGIIHTIEDVLVPVTATIADRLEDARYSIFYEAMVAAGYETMLRTVYTQETDPQGNPIEVRYRYTAFAVANEVYQQHGIQSFAELIAALDAGVGPYNVPDNALHSYVSYHLLHQWQSFAELGVFPGGEQTKNINTLAENQLMSISDTAGELLINYDPDNNDGIRFNEANIPSKNGVIHEVNHWMPIFTPPQVVVVWELTDYPDLAANVTQYRNPSLGAQYNRTFQQGELTSYHWVSQPEDKFNVLTYRNNRAAEGIWYTDVLNYDHLRIELGESGWMEMESPVIVKGTYRLKVIWPSPRQASTTGICAFALDGQMLRPRHNISNTREDRVLEETLGTVTFTETEPHTLRVVSLDGRLITLDYIRFEPMDEQ
ncbi:fasciclin domain-containing protein [Parapedobacter tibetensis]|uniref:fasciclin domain-containing protein n=1 Tax=Parapedobacter tibetensis TaxID=2972951 RepID=UPI00214D9640|nr:fasciclin domain-containing protein [Parapedobacter tibetensis]